MLLNNIINQLAEHRAKDEFQAGFELCEQECKNVRSDEFDEFHAFFAYYTGHYDKSLNLYKHNQYFSKNDAITQLCDYNIRFSAIKVVDKYIEYNPENVQRLVDYFNSDKDGKEPLVTFTTTTCKRLDLFKNTINSFLACCLDLTTLGIDKWYVIDDNSTEEDRGEMQRLYPFITLIKKTPSQKGHARSLNMLLKLVKTKYLFNLEDDWQFYHPDNYMTYLYEIVNDDPNVKQALLNNTYSEVPTSEKLVGGYYRRSRGMELNYIIHEFTRTDEERAAFNTKWGFHPNCAYWPHFSLRPGLSEVSIFDELGIFQEDVWHFEMNYAYHYVDKGYQTAFLPGMVCKHIGKLTSDKTGINAYVLNDEAQFTGVKKITPIRELQIACVNLDRRPDRWEQFKKTTLHLSTPIARFSAVDGYKLDVPMHPQLYHLFDTNDYNYRSGIVGCALSHMSLWIDYLYNPTSKKYLMVMEDDLYFNDKCVKDGVNFEDKLEQCLSTFGKLDGDIMCLQYTRRYPGGDDPDLKFIVVNSPSDALKYSYGGTGCYVITRRGVEKILAFINTHGMTNAIDTVIQKSAQVLKLIYVEPLLTVLDMGEADTDIQNDFNHLNITIDNLIKHELKWLYQNYNLKLDIEFTINSTRLGTAVYSYPLQHVWVNLTCPTSPKFKRERPNERLVVDGKFKLPPLLLLQ